MQSRKFISEKRFQNNLRAGIVLCLTSRGSGVRLPYLPQLKIKVLKTVNTCYLSGWQVFFFCFFADKFSYCNLNSIKLYFLRILNPLF